MVGETRLAQDRTALQPVAQRRRHELVIDAPTDVVGARRAAVAPPGVVLAFRVERAVGIDPAAHAAGRAVAAAVLADPAVEPGALGRQAAGVLLVRLPVLDVQRAAHDVPVAAQPVVAAAGQPLAEDRPQPVPGLELAALTQLARRPPP